MNDLSSVWVVAGLLGIDLSIKGAQYCAICIVARDIAHYREWVRGPRRPIRGVSAEVRKERKCDRFFATVGNLTGYFQ